MTPRDLKAHKIAPKQLKDFPEFKARKRMQRPFKHVGGPRIFSSGILEVSDTHSALMFWRDGQILTDRAFFGHLFCRLTSGSSSPIFEFHWHPNHKGIHCKTPCMTENDYTDRNLPGAPELSIKTAFQYDPKKLDDLKMLVMIFCKSCGILLPVSDHNTKQLW